MAPNPMRQRGPSLLLHAGGPVVLRVILALLPVPICAVLALALMAGGGAAIRLDDRAAFAFPAAMLPLCVAGLCLCLPQLTPPATKSDAPDLRGRATLAVASLAWLGHAFVLVMGLRALVAATPPTTAVDLAFSVGTLAFLVSAIAFYQACGHRLRALEYWVTGDDEGSLLSSGVGLLVLWPLAALGLLAAAVAWWGSAPHFRLVWRLDALYLVLATIGLAFRSLRMLRYLLHTHRLAREHLSREERIAEKRREQFGE